MRLAQFRSNVECADRTIPRHGIVLNMPHDWQQYNGAVSAYSGLGSRVDAVLLTATASLTDELAAKLTSLNTHWQHQRSINPSQTSVENDTQDDPPFNTVHHVESEQVWFHTNHHTFWATYVYRRARTRTRSVPTTAMSCTRRGNLSATRSKCRRAGRGMVGRRDT